ncbi:sensor histidine kinase [Streptomyces sp. NPDC001315]|uniref:sensor histidine kinase n=1 Tax=Streptomyces sp. NPDC001315 TaxID=3364562 RepID=UPI0036B7903C
MNANTQSSGIGTRARNAALASGRGFVLSLVSLPEAILCYTLSVISIALIPVLGLGLLTTPWALTRVRSFADRRRILAAKWCGIRIPSAYRPLPEGGKPWARTYAMLQDPATWRDLRWLLVDMTAGYLTALMPAALVLYAVEGFALAAGLWRVYADTTGDTYWYAFVPVSGQASALCAAALAAVFLVLGYFYTPRLLTTHFRLTRAVLAPSQGELAERVRILTETRRDAVDTSAAELRRIERDLHDGAQARLVAMGMDLGTIEMLLDKDPEKARQLLTQARQSSADALAELRDLVRGIHPPVLAERGLGDAVRALALRMPLATEVTVELDGRADAPVESAAYFAVSELLTNAVKHANADRIWVDLHHTDGMLRITVTDNGRGGAAIGAGSGLAGVERRLGTFDGVLAVSSPAGGPTMVTMELPCELS